MAERIIGLDLGNRVVKAVEVALTFNGFRTKDFIQREVDKKLKAEEVYPSLLRELSREKKWKGSKIILALSSHLVLSRKITFPFSDLKKIKQALKFEAEPLLPFPLEELAIDFLPFKEEGKKRKVLMLAIKREDLERYLKILRQADLEAELIFPDLIAYLPLLTREVPREKGKAIVYLDIGAKKTIVNILKDGELVLTRSLSWGGDLCTEAISKGLSLRWEEAEEKKKALNQTGKGERSEIYPLLLLPLTNLKEEVEQTFLSYSGEEEGPSISALRLSGGGAKLKEIGQFLGKELSKEVTLFDYFPSPYGKKGPIPLPDPAFFIGTGIALAGVRKKGKRKIGFNWLEEGLREKLGRIKGKAIYLLIFFFLSSLLAWADFHLLLHSKQVKYDHLKKELRGIFKEVFPPASKVVDEVHQARGIVKEEETLVKIMGEGFLSPLEPLKELSRIIKNYQKMRITELIMESNYLELSGETDNFDQVNKFRIDLENSPLFQKAEVKGTKVSSLEKIVEFKMRLYP